MRRGKLLLSLAALAFAAIVSISASGVCKSAELGPTDSGAPSAIVIFPVGEKPNPAGAGMAPVAFNHVIHEKWMNKTGKDCLVCHHTGDPVACTNCHTVDGKQEGKFVTLYKAMHTDRIRKRNEYTPSSCVSCHEAQLKQRDCAGCHTQLVKNPMENDRWCTVCHTITPAMTRSQMQQGIKNTLPERDNEVLGIETAETRTLTKYWSPIVGPYKVEINSMASKYEPVLFNHRHHVISLVNRIESNSLAGTFHTNPATVCMTCHHNTPASATPPKCINCHSTSIKATGPGKPALMAAFHLQCMNCHKDMKVGRPRSTDCTTCHKAAPVKAAVN